MTAAVTVLGYVVASRPDGIGVEIAYEGEVLDAPGAAERYCTEPGDFVVAICEVTP